MIDINNYIKLPAVERKKHLILNDECIERGGNSIMFRGLLAHYLNTTIPKGRILCCHACHNKKCSNPKHLYWGTDKENYEDAKTNGTIVNPYDATIRKYGKEKARQMCSEYGKRGGKATSLIVSRKRNNKGKFIS